ncbi:MAG TPA: glycosyltransferase family 2 protein [Gemmatimonadales bacterium]|nr:glycosyltransferase family 2 protein [Gemmatimonadales bacterium]
MSPEAATHEVAVVVPAFRASRTIADVVTRVRAAVPLGTVLVVDDGSDDDTAALALAAGAAVASHERNLGKGRALATGLAAAAALDGMRWTVTLDADGQHPPEHIPDLLAPLVSGAADLVIGARARSGTPMPPARRFTNWLSSTLVSRGTGQAVPDSQSGFRAMTRAVVERIRPNGSRYEFETEFLFDAAAAGFRIRSQPVPTLYGSESSHFRSITDTMRIARTFVRHWREIL